MSSNQSNPSNPLKIPQRRDRDFSVEKEDAIKLHKNLRDLNTISEQLLNEFNRKNKVITESIKDCENCEKVLLKRN